MDAERSSVLVVSLPGADGIVGHIRREHDPSARDGMPAHVTLLTPFVPPGRWHATHAARLAQALSSVTPFDARFRRTGRFGTTTVYLVPEPEDTFMRLATSVAAAFPEHPPYGGAFSAVLPHLTLAHGVPEATLDAVESAMKGCVDFRMRVTDVVLFSRAASGRWTEGPRIPLPTRPGS